MAEETLEIERLKAENEMLKGEIDRLKHRVANSYPPFKSEEHKNSEYQGGGMWSKKGSG